MAITEPENVEDVIIRPEDIPKAALVGKPLLVFTSCFVSICVFLFGYDQGYFSSILTNEHFEEYYNNPSSVQIGTVVAVLEIGALLSSLTLGHVAEKLGRKRTTRLGSLFFCIGGTIQTLSTSFHHLGVGRFISGLGVGFLSGTAPTYMSEIASPDIRGLLGSAQFTGNVLGYSTSIWIDYGCSFIDSDLSFRMPLGLQVAFGLVLFFGSYALVESPRWLLEHGHDVEGLIVLADLFAQGRVYDPVAVEAYKSIEETVLVGRLEGKLSSWQAIRRYPKRIFVGCSAQMFAQFNGINVISYYAPLVFEEAGWLGKDAILMTGYNSILYLLSTLLPWWLSESWGRKPLLLLGSCFMGVGLVFIALFTRDRVTTMVVAFVMLFNSSFGISWGPIGWLIGPEVLPNKARASGAALSTATNWLCNFIVGQCAPILLELISWRLYLIHALSCLVSFLVVWLFYPETKGLSLEDMDSVFGDKSAASSYISRNNSSGSSSSSVTSSQNPLSCHTYQNSLKKAHSDMAISASKHNKAIQARTNPTFTTSPLMPNEISPMLGAQDLTAASESFLRNLPPHQQNGMQGRRWDPTASPFITPADLEPPDLKSVYKFKTDDSRSIQSSIKRGKKVLSSVFRFRKTDRSRSDSDAISERFLNDDV